MWLLLWSLIISKETTVHINGLYSLLIWNIQANTRCIIIIINRDIYIRYMWNWYLKRVKLKLQTCETKFEKCETEIYNVWNWNLKLKKSLLLIDIHNGDNHHNTKSIAFRVNDCLKVLHSPYTVTFAQNSLYLFYS